MKKEKIELVEAVHKARERSTKLLEEQRTFLSKPYKKFKASPFS